MTSRRRPETPGGRGASPSGSGHVSHNSTPSLKPPLTLEDWEERAPLSEKAVQNVSFLKKACERRPLPLKFIEDPEDGPSRVSTPRLPNSRPGTPSNAGAVTASSSSITNGHTPSASMHVLHPLHPTHPIHTPQQFYDWFTTIERTISHSQESQFRKHLQTVEEHLARCELMKEKVKEVGDGVRRMLDEWRAVDEGAESLQEACERLLEERDRLLEVTDAIALRLEYYQELEHATRMLNHPGDALVLQADFLLMVERVDVCLEFFNDHRHFAEADVYLFRFQQCMTRAMTLIKMYFVGALKALTADIQRMMADKNLSSTAEHHLLYAKFRSLGTQVAPLIAELENRATAHPEELSSLLSECQSAYLSARKGLVAGRLVVEIRALDPAKSDLIELTRAGCSYLKQLCTEEFDLYRVFFNSGEDKLYRYLESLCDYLYDDLRPRILHEPHLTVLCQVCTILQALMVLDVSTEDPTLIPTNSNKSLTSPTSTTSDPNITSPGTTIAGQLISFVGIDVEPSLKPIPIIRQRLHISHLLQMILQDAQTRLFFKAQALIQSDIRYYVVAKGDLEYPKKLIDFKNGTLSPPERPMSPTIGSDELFAGLSSANALPTWYPTLQKLHWILSLLYDFVKPSIFADMAQEAITTCGQSLISASRLLASQNASQPQAQSSGSTSTSTSSMSTELDARLFLVRHLLVLKEIASIVSAAVLEASKGVEGSLYEKAVIQQQQNSFMGTTDALGAILRGTSSLFGTTNLLGGLTSYGTSVKEETPSAFLDQELKRVCEELIASASDSATAPLRSTLTLTSTQSTSPTPLEILQTFKSTAQSEIQSWTSKVRLYLDDPRTVSILVAPLHGSIVREYEAYEQRRKAAELAGGNVGGIPEDEQLSSARLWSLLRDWSDSAEDFAS